MCFDYWKFWHMDKATWNMAKSKTLWTSDKPNNSKFQITKSLQKETLYIEDLFNINWLLFYWTDINHVFLKLDFNSLQLVSFLGLAVIIAQIFYSIMNLEVVSIVR